MYRDKFKFAAEGGTLGTPKYPPGKIKDDEKLRQSRDLSQGSEDPDPGRRHRPGDAQGRLAGVLGWRHLLPADQPGGACSRCRLARHQFRREHRPAVRRRRLLAPRPPRRRRNIAHRRPVQGRQPGAGAAQFLRLRPAAVADTLRLPDDSRSSPASSSTTAMRSATCAPSSCRWPTCWAWPSPTPLVGVAAGLSGTLLSAALQNAWVLGGFALVFVVLSLSMFGFYELQMPAAHCKARSPTPPTARAARCPPLP
jgi:hypothetical protein